jgi:hypothetical protein
MELDSSSERDRLNQVCFVNYSFTEQQGPDQHFYINLKGNSPKEIADLQAKVLSLEKLVDFSSDGLNYATLVARFKDSSKDSYSSDRVQIFPVKEDLGRGMYSSGLSLVFANLREPSLGMYFTSNDGSVNLSAKDNPSDPNTTHTKYEIFFSDQSKK